jgi:hypothetical protein
MSKFSSDPCYQAFRLLQIVFIALPILAGIDKFFYLLDNWSEYLSPFVLRIIHHHDHGLMMFAGVVEISAGIGVFFKPRIFAYIVSLWLLVIIMNLLLTGNYFDIILRDLGLLIAAFSLGRLSEKYAN